jgi:hypothetical protein
LTLKVLNRHIALDRRGTPESPLKSVRFKVRRRAPIVRRIHPTTEAVLATPASRYLSHPCISKAIVTGPGVETTPGQLGAQRDDPCGHGLRRPTGARPRTTGARFEGNEAAIPIPAERALEVLPADAELGCGSGDGPLPGNDLKNGDSVLRHGADRRACPDSPVTDQVSPLS